MQFHNLSRRSDLIGCFPDGRLEVRILNGSTAAVTRVLIESTDATGARWRTVGVSDSIIDASFQALTDSIIYKLMKNREQVGQIAAE